MKKIFSYIIILFVFIFSFSMNVDAIGGHNLIYHVYDLSVSGSSLTFDGFAFIDHMDNHGGKNLKTYIIAKAEDSVIYNEEVDSYYGSDDKSYYYIRCEGDGCDVSFTANINNKRTNCNRDGYSDCAYYNVKFKKTVNLNEIIQTYKSQGKTGDIKLYIKCIANDKEIESELGVYDEICGDSCEKNITVGDSTVNLLELSNDVKITATNANKRKWDSLQDSGSNFEFESVHEVFTYEAKEILIHGEYIITNFFVVAGGQYAIYDSWAQMPHGIKISFGPPPPPTPDLSCDTGYDSPDGPESRQIACDAKATYKECTDENVGFSVKYQLSESQSAAQVDPTGSGDPCGEEDGEVDVDVSTTILIHQYGEFNLGSIASTVYTGRGFKFPTLDYTNKIYFRYGLSDGKIVYTANVKYGKWIETEAEYDYVTGPNGESRWDYNGDGYWDVVEISPATYECDPDGNSYTLQLDDTVEGDDCGTLKECMNKASNNVVYNSIGTKGGFDRVTGIVPKSYDSNEYDSGATPSESVLGNWSGEKYSDEFGMSSNAITESKSEEKERKYSFSIFDAYIKLIGDKFSYIEYSDSDKGDGYRKLLGKKYFVPLRFPEDEDFVVDIPGFVDVSFVNKLDWLFHADCTIDVINKVWGKVYYRPIDISVPFPEGNSNAPVNWKNWINIPANVNRLESSYNSDKKNYSVVLKKGESSGNILGIAELNRNVQNYNIWDMDDDVGTSNYLTDLGSKLHKTNASYCPIGKFSESCNG